MLSVVINFIFMLSVILLNVVMLSVILLNVVSVVVPFWMDTAALKMGLFLLYFELLSVRLDNFDI